MAELKDSGERKIFEQVQLRYFKGKGRCDLLPLDTIVYILDLDGNKDEFECINDLKTGHIAHLKYAILIFNEEKIMIW